MAEISFEILKENSESDELKAFLDKTENCTIFHKPSFLGYHDKNKFNVLSGFTFYHFLFRDEKSNIIAFIPGAVHLTAEGKKIFKTPFYSSYGGMVYDETLKFDEFEKIIEIFLSGLQKENIKEIIFTQTADCYCGSKSDMNNYISYILKLKGFELANIEMIMVKQTEGDTAVNFHGTIQRQIKQAIKNELQFKAENMFSSKSYELLEKSQKRLGGKPTHSLDELMLLFNLFKDKLIAFSTLKDDMLIAGMIGFVCNKNVLNTFYIFDDEEKRELKGMQFTYYNVLQWAKERSFSYVDFGPATFGLIPHYSLINYKEKFGSVPMLRNTFTANFD